jgi:hypothetical protein
MEVAVSGDAESAARPSVERRRARPSLEERARQQGVRPIRSADELVREHVFEAEGELDEFLAHLYASRRSDLA